MQYLRYQTFQEVLDRNITREANKNIHSLYIVIGYNCQLNCSFCFNKFDEKFINAMDKDLDRDPEIFARIIDNYNPEMVTFIGGEPLMDQYAKIIIDTINSYRRTETDDKVWCLSTNLAYKQFTDNQIKCMKLMQEDSIDDIAIGSSYSVDRFYEKDKYFELWKKNMLFLDSIGINVGVTLTLTEKQFDQPVDEVIDLLMNQVKAKMVNIERCIFPEPKTEKEVKKLEFFYKKSDIYMKECFEKFPKEFNKQYSRFEDAINYNIPVFSNKCSQSVLTIYPTVKREYLVRKGCICNSVGVDPMLWMDKVTKYECITCNYYALCHGDCECNRFACAFPKHTIDYMKNEVKGS